MPTENSPEYTYEYHWGRIIIVACVAAAVVVAAVFSFLRPGPEDAETPVAVPAISYQEAPEKQTEIAVEIRPEQTSLKNAQPKQSVPQQVTETEETANSGAVITVAKTPKTASIDSKQPTDTRTKAELFTATIKRAQLTTQVKQLEPGKELPEDYQGNPDDLSKIYFYTEVLGEAGKTHYHRWYHNGKLAAKVPIAIGSDRWRCYSSKYLTPDQTGEWEVKVTDARGKLLAKSQFHFASAE